MIRLPAAFAAALLFINPSHAARPDLASTAGFEATCANVHPPVTVQEQQAFVICNDIATVQHVRTFIERAIAQAEKKPMTDRQFARAIRGELHYVRNHLRRSRQLLERIRLDKTEDGLTIAPLPGCAT